MTKGGHKMGIMRISLRAVTALLASFLLVGATGLVGFNQGLAALNISQTLEPQRIFIKGSGVNPEVATVTLQLEAPRPSDRLTADVVLVVDRSASFELEDAVEAARRILDRLGPNDRVGLVSFAGEATLDVRLTPVSEAQGVRDALARLTAEGKTALGEGIAVATDELALSGRSDAALVQILLTDGRTNFGRDPLEEAKKAVDRNVVIHAVGIGRFINRDLLTQIAQTTGGQFFPTFNDAIVNQALRVSVPTGGPLATNIEITETLSKEIQLEQTLENAPTRTTRNSDGTTTLSWQRSSLRAGEIWTIRYTVSGSQIGIFSLHRSPSFVRYRDFRDRDIQRDLPAVLTVDVRSRPPLVTPDFSFSPSNPTTFDDIQFTDESTVERGKIVRWLWDFGDGATSTDQKPTHRYVADGQYRVKLIVTSDEGVEAESSTTIPVFTPLVAVRRTIDTSLPVDQTIPGQTFRVTLDIRVNGKVTGLGIDENIPSGWTIKAIDNSTAELRAEDTQWLFNAVLERGTAKTIIYEVTVPQTQTAGSFSIGGAVSSALPSFSLPVSGDSRIDILSGFSIPMVVAHYDVNTQALDLKRFSTHKIDLNQILRAISWWREGQEVPFTEDSTGKKQKIDFTTIQSLVAYWLTDTSVFDPLPKEP